MLDIRLVLSLNIRARAMIMPALLLVLETGLALDLMLVLGLEQMFRVSISDGVKVTVAVHAI